MSKFTDAGYDWALAQAVLLGFECRPTDFPPGFRWNSGTQLGQWAPTKADAITSFLSIKGYLVDVGGELHRI